MAACVTPSNSQESPEKVSTAATAQRRPPTSAPPNLHPTFIQLLQHDGLDQAEWQRLQRNSQNCPNVWQGSTTSATGRNDDPTAAPTLFHGTATVQDMLQPQFYCHHRAGTTTSTTTYDDDETNIVEQTQLVLRPVTVGSVKHHHQQHDDDNDIINNATSSKRFKSRHWPEIVAKFYFDQYPAEQQQQLCLNNLVEFVGVWEETTSSRNTAGQPEEFTMEDYNDTDDSVMTEGDGSSFHILWYRRIPTLEQLMWNNSVSSGISSQENLHSDDSVEFIKLLSQALQFPPNNPDFGVVAHALAVTLMSKAERTIAYDENKMMDFTKNHVAPAPVTTPHETVLGCASLHLRLSTYQDCLAMQQHLLQTLMPLVPLVQVLDATQPLPYQQSNGRLQSTPWQMVAGTVVIVNVADNNNTISPAQQVALEELTLLHRVPYQFEGGTTIRFEADVRIIVLSSSTVSTLPCTTLQVRLSLPLSSVVQEQHSPDLHNIIRWWLAQGRGCFKTNTNVRLPNMVLAQARDDFLRQRQTQSPVGEEDFHRWLTLARLQTRLRRASETSLMDWQRALELDRAMRGTFVNFEIV